MIKFFNDFDNTPSDETPHIMPIFAEIKVERDPTGENEPEMLWETTMSPATRRLIQVTPEESEHTSAVFDLLLGDNLQGRKDYIAENGAAYLELADIS